MKFAAGRPALCITEEKVASLIAHHLFSRNTFFDFRRYVYIIG